MRFKMKYLRIGFAFTVIAVMIVYLGLDVAYAQPTVSGPKRQIVVGELLGRTDIRELKIQTRLGRIHLISSGNSKPFAIVNQSPARIELQFHASYELKKNNPNKIIYRFYETERALMSALILEEVDFAVLENEVTASEVGRSNNHIVPLPQYMTPNTVKMICYNHRKAILKSRKVRRALAYAINHNDILKKIILGGKANLARGPFDDDSPLYNPGMESYKYNPKLAIELLKEAGWRDKNREGVLQKAGVPFRITLYFQKGLSIDEAISRQVKINLLKIGVDVNPRPLTKSEINDHLHTRDFDAVLMDYTFENNIASLEEFFSANGSNNYMSYHSNTIENYLKFYHEIDDEKQKVTLIKSMQSIINRDQPVNFFYFKWLTHYLVNVNKFENFRNLESKEALGRFRPFEEWIIKNAVEE